MISKSVEHLDRVIIRFAGDSGDGIQLTGDRFTSETALTGNDLATLPDFPAEIRAPAGSLPGVSGFQVHFADHDIFTSGDQPNVLVAMNPAALKTNIADVPKGGTVSFTVQFTRTTATLNAYTGGQLTLTGSQGHVVRIPMVVRPVALGFKTDEIQRTIAIGEA